MATEQGTQLGACKGVCKKWFADRGFGFIERVPKDPSEGDIFVHFSGISQHGRKSLNIGENVTFDMGKDAKSGKPRAENVSGDESGTRSEDLYPNSKATNRAPSAYGTTQFGQHPFTYNQQQQPYAFSGFGYGTQQQQQQQPNYNQYPQPAAQSYSGTFGNYNSHYGQQNFV